MRNVSNTLDHLSLPACLLNFLLGGGGVGGEFHIERLRQRTVAEDLDAVKRLFDDTLFNQGVRVYRTAGLELFQVANLNGCLLYTSRWV